MTPAKFSVGESVIVVSNSQGTFTAEVTEGRYGTRRPLRGGPPRTGWAYWVAPDIDILPWAEYRLRKRPKGTGKGLTEFMDSLKQLEVTT